MIINIPTILIIFISLVPAYDNANLGSTEFLIDRNQHEIPTEKDSCCAKEFTKITKISELDDKDKPKENCTPHSLEEFPEDLFTAEQRRQGAVALHTFFGLYCFLMTALVCNDYLLPSLDCICTRMKISSDVAGATFLAAASSFPELFVNIIGTFLTESDLGVGTVMGSAVFDTFATPACGALSAFHVIQLEWRILTRDCIFNVISVGTLVVIMWDGVIELYEAAILIALLIAYLIILFCGKYFIRWYKKLARLFTSKTGSTAFSGDESPENKEEPMTDGLYRPYFHGELVAEYRKKSLTSNAVHKTSTDCAVEAQNHVKMTEEYIEPNTPFIWPSGDRLAKIWFWFIWPLRLILFVTVPDSRYKRWKNWYPVTFVMCVTWIAITSYLVSWMMTVLGDTMGISDSIMGLTFLAAGGNMPELISIVILARQGNGNMGMSNTLGANTLDILMCLGLPWLIKTSMTGKSVHIVSGALSYSVLSIIVCVIIFYTVVAMCRYQLNKTVGVICLILYAIFLVFAILVELNVFFHANLPMC
ncbi:sodium/potassium/calcium exchanger 4 [Harpegnathos saltator]|uniref:Sodium/potassium/calcium exchanger 5 n=1 Tax=Harpegnathos saltator TaxID=610380 RepID=E2C4F0_HARSA|nr:sodium/potassium/calcium exchanger 4 [Harpegnathos saltator]EFN77187.1 Sodium/potassium/calcium exchanger 5 [Harpegnathos saltator]